MRWLSKVLLDMRTTKEGWKFRFYLSCFVGPQVIAEYLQKVDPKSDGAKRDWVAIYDECASVLYQVAPLLHQKKSSALLLNCFSQCSIACNLQWWYFLSSLCRKVLYFRLLSKFPYCLLKANAQKIPHVVRLDEITITN